MRKGRPVSERKAILCEHFSMIQETMGPGPCVNQCEHFSIIQETMGPGPCVNQCEYFSITY